MTQFKSIFYVYEMGNISFTPKIKKLPHFVAASGLTDYGINRTYFKLKPVSFTSLLFPPIKSLNSPGSAAYFNSLL